MAYFTRPTCQLLVEGGRLLSEEKKREYLGEILNTSSKNSSVATFYLELVLHSTLSNLKLSCITGSRPRPRIDRPLAARHLPSEGNYWPSYFFSIGIRRLASGSGQCITICEKRKPLFYRFLSSVFTNPLSIFQDHVNAAISM